MRRLLAAFRGIIVLVKDSTRFCHAGSAGFQKSGSTMASFAGELILPAFLLAIRLLPPDTWACTSSQHAAAAGARRRFGIRSTVPIVRTF